MLLTTTEVAERLGVTKQTLRNWREAGTSPPFILLSPKVLRYPADQLQVWLAEHTR